MAGGRGVVTKVMNRLVLAFAAIPALVIAHSFAEGVAGYLNGTATLRGAGYPGPEYHNLDPEYRVYRRTSGCLVTGTEILTHIPNNVAIALLTKVFGPMRGTFDGPYPSRAEAKTALQGAGPGRRTGPDLGQDGDGIVDVGQSAGIGRARLPGLRHTLPAHGGPAPGTMHDVPGAHRFAGR
jgi:hypothetical protein